MIRGPLNDGLLSVMGFREELNPSYNSPREVAMKASFGAALMALSLHASSAGAAEMTPRAAHARHQRLHHPIVVARIVDRRPVYGYLGRPVYYTPAPFPLGFDFGFGW